MDKQIQTTELGTSPVEVVKTPRYAWVILAITYFASITAPLGQFKVTAIAGEIIGAYGLNYASFGMLPSSARFSHFRRRSSAARSVSRRRASSR